MLAAASLYEQSLAKLFLERFSDPRICHLFVKASSGEILGERWPDAARPVAPGSLVKVFTALAYGDTHGDRFPELLCGGEASGCWLPRGHGKVGIVEAVAHSCNAYFRALASSVRIDNIDAVAMRYGVEPPPAGAAADALVGIGSAWKITPASLARAYCRLLTDPRAADVVRGMALSAVSGTGSAVESGLVKTGTAPCIHRPRAPGDGFALVMFPAPRPEYALLVRVHGTTGAQAAARIGVLGLFKPKVLVVRPAPGGALIMEADGQQTALEGGQSMVVRGPLRAHPRGGGEFILSVPGKIERRYRGDLEITAHGGVLSAVVSMDRETAVASAVAAESPPGAPLAALMAQAVATRSYYAAARGRHEDFEFCDTTHCQFLRAPPAPDTPASTAARRTQGLVLTWNGALFPALFSASCGGRTRALANPDGGEYPYFEVECPYCLHGPRERAGHGFGLCQTGAKAMAAAGASFREILDHYYPSAEITASLP